MGKPCSKHGNKRKSCGILTRKPEGKRPLGRPRLRWTDIVTYLCDYRRSLGWRTGFVDNLRTQLRTTSNYSATANLHNSQNTTALAKPFPACCLHQPFPSNCF
jgi:hypothetical protein